MAFADLADLEDRLDLNLSEQEQRMALAALEDCSEMARFYSGGAWEDDAAPRIVKVIVLNTVARYIRNPDAYVTSKAGDESLTWSDMKGKGGLVFTPAEQAILEGIAVAADNTFGTFGTFAWRSKPLPVDGYVTTDPVSYYTVDPLSPTWDFPFWAKEDEPLI